MFRRFHEPLAGERLGFPLDPPVPRRTPLPEANNPARPLFRLLFRPPSYGAIRGELITNR